MKTVFTALSLSILFLSGCQTVQDMQVTRSVPQPVVHQSDNRLEVQFDDDTSLLSHEERRALDQFIMKHEIKHNDELVINVALQGGTLAEKRAEKVAAYFRSFGLKPQFKGLEAAQGLQKIGVSLRRYRVSVPNCPNWTDDPNATYHNQPHSNFGCATAANLALMIGNPRDLVRGRDLSAADGAVLSNSLIQYRQPRSTSTTQTTGGGTK
ncbi:CpaD family pilus assembly lipoprotein [Terasakiella sp. SH-1]|uniref:CpaD family pilus assembly lipoprotein n=1 Tax=Terasakiella sp. SH-1 TaxID=2560057 RepID=UPI001431AA45|nr:CpaD family pilus assembly lipoprotein [Terasakiella sp. SH-1]